MNKKKMKTRGLESCTESLDESLKKKKERKKERNKSNYINTWHKSLWKKKHR